MGQVIAAAVVLTKVKNNNLGTDEIEVLINNRYKYVNRDRCQTHTKEH